MVPTLTLRQRRWINSILVLIAAAVGCIWYYSYRQTLGDYRPRTGWTLLGAVVFLALYNARKKLPFLPLGRSSTWLQLHIYVGLLSIIGFLFHIGFSSPTGTFERVLALAYVAVAATGVGGLVLTRLVPPRLARSREEVIFERIPAFLTQLRTEAEALALQSIEATRSTALADFYEARLVPFFAGPRNCVRHLLSSPAPLRDLEDEMSRLRSCLSTDESGYLDELEEVVRAKNDIDFHHAHQGALKYWLFLHIPLTYCLLLLVATHLVLVFTYGAAR